MAPRADLGDELKRKELEQLVEQAKRLAAEIGLAPGELAEKFDPEPADRRCDRNDRDRQDQELLERMRAPDAQHTELAL